MPDRDRPPPLIVPLPSLRAMMPEDSSTRREIERGAVLRLRNRDLADRPRTLERPPPSWIVKEKGEEVGWIRVQPNYHDQLVPEPGQEIMLVPEVPEQTDEAIQ